MFGACACFVWLAGSHIGGPVPSEPGPAPAGYLPISLTSRSGAELAGWLHDPAPDKPLVLLLHPFRANRRSMLGRARFLAEAGHAVLLFDFQAHGESSGDRMSFGHRESGDVQSALAFARRKNALRPVAALGISLGGAAVLLASPPLALDAVVLEAVYPSIDAAVRNRLEVYLAPAARVFAPLLTLQLGPRLGIDRAALRPIEGMRRLTAPALVVAGTDDRRTTLAESRRLFESASSPKEFWAVPGARHENFHRFAPAEYETRILEFLERHLGRP